MFYRLTDFGMETLGKGHIDCSYIRSTLSGNLEPLYQTYDEVTILEAGRTSLATVLDDAYDCILADKHLDSMIYDAIDKKLTPKQAAAKTRVAPTREYIRTESDSSVHEAISLTDDIIKRFYSPTYCLPSLTYGGARIAQSQFTCIILTRLSVLISSPCILIEVTVWRRGDRPCAI